MSQLVGGADGAAIINRTNTDLNIQSQQIDIELTPVETGFRTPWWPGAGWIEQGDAGDAGLHPLGGDWWEPFEVTRGAAYRFAFVGVTRDVYGSPLGACTVKCYRTSTDEMVGLTISDPVGNFLVTTPYYPDAHYLVCYKSGSPDVQGTSANNIIGS